MMNMAFISGVVILALGLGGAGIEMLPGLVIIVGVILIGHGIVLTWSNNGS